MSHTPGPWLVHHEKWVIATRGVHAGEILIAPTYWMEHAKEEAAANARLIASAPDLLEALRQIAQCSDGDDTENYRFDDREGCLDTVHSMAKEAIARATGEKA